MSGSAVILGAGAGGLAAAVDLTLRGWAVRVWHPRRARLEPLLDGAPIAYTGVLGDGTIRPHGVGEDLGSLLRRADAAIVCLPAFELDGVVDALAGAEARVPVVLNPGHTGGALRVRARLAAAGAAIPPVAALSTLTYVARSPHPGAARVTGLARAVRGAALPGGSAALDLAVALFPQVDPVRDVLGVDLANTNLVLHPPGAVLGAAWVEATGGDFTFYGQGMTPGVVRVLESLDAERRAVARAFGHDLPPLATEMARIGTAEATAAARGDTLAAIAGNPANAPLRAPDSLSHRYYREDFGHGLLPLTALAAAADVPVPTAAALLQLAEAMLGVSFVADGGTDAARLGVAGLDAAGVLALASGAPA